VMSRKFSGSTSRWVCEEQAASTQAANTRPLQVQFDGLEIIPNSIEPEIEFIV